MVTAAPPTANVGEELIQVIPSALWALVVLIALYVLREPIRSLLGRLQSARLPGNVKLTFGPALKRAVEEASKRLELRQTQLWLTPLRVETLLSRAERNAEAIVGGRVLWVDDQPEGNLWVRDAMDALGMSVTTARSTEEAAFFLEQGRIDLVILDMTRPGEESNGRKKAGIQLRDAMHRYGVTAPLIFYVLDLDLEQQPPERTFAITNRPDELLDYVLDALTARR
jgi:CheY-like chemotaxis protein